MTSSPIFISETLASNIIAAVLSLTIVTLGLQLLGISPLISIFKSVFKKSWGLLHSSYPINLSDSTSNDATKILSSIITLLRITRKHC